MKRKTRIRVKGEWVRVEHVDLSVEELLGDADINKRVIRIEISLTDKEYKRVLAHEKMHMILGLSGLAELLSAELEEGICVAMETP